MLLDHVEMVYRPGERALAQRFFELLGTRVVDRGGRWMLVLADPDAKDVSNNAFYASETTAEQWMLEQALAAAIGESPDDNDRIGADPDLAGRLELVGVYLPAP